MTFTIFLSSSNKVYIEIFKCQLNVDQSFTSRLRTRKQKYTSEVYVYEGTYIKKTYML